MRCHGGRGRLTPRRACPSSASTARRTCRRASRSAAPGDVPVHARQLPGRLPRPAVDVPPVLRLRHRRGVQRALPATCSSQGGTGLSVALDLPTQCGYDSDDPDVEEEVGRVGVAIDTLADAEILFDQIPLDQISHQLHDQRHRRDPARVLRRGRREAGRRRASRCAGRSRTTSSRSTPRRGTWIWPPKPSLRLIADTIEFCADEVPRFNAISVAGAHFRDAGANAAQEMAFTLQDGVTYCDEVISRGRMTIDQFAPQISFFFYTHGDFFEEVAKYRAGRRRWARIVRERFGAQEDKLLHVPLRLRVRRRVALRAAGAEQHRARRLRGDGSGARRRAVDVHRGVGRAVRAPRPRSRRRSRCARSRSSPTRPASHASSIRSAARTTSRR